MAKLYLSNVVHGFIYLCFYKLHSALLLVIIRIRTVSKELLSVLLPVILMIKGSTAFYITYIVRLPHFLFSFVLLPQCFLLHCVTPTFHFYFVLHMINAFFISSLAILLITCKQSSLITVILIS